MLVDPDREVFPCPFVRLVEAFVGFDSKLTDADHAAILRSVLDADYDVMLPSPDDENAGGELFSAVRKADLVVVEPENLHISTAKYVRWERFRDVLTELLQLVTMGRGIHFVSVLFLDEIRPPSSTDLLGWSEYVNLPTVTREVVLDHVSGAYGGLVLHLDDNKHINIEWTPTFEPAFEHNHPLHEHYDEPEEGLLAVEWKGWCRLEGQTSTEVALGELDSLHATIKESFLKVLTPASMKLLRGEP
ncbi:MAG: TIGR04255 family protein [Acidimicrobiaceae bacterium]|nr:TIGR04255 family protein [Acidimicrobiaceae bacterium]